MSADDAGSLNRSQLAWRCRRGVKELDLLLLGWLSRHFDTATATERERFAALLALPDPDLARYLLGSERPPEPALAAAVEAVRAFPGPRAAVEPSSARGL